MCAITLNLGFSLRVPYCVVDAGYGLGRSLGDCRPALPKGQNKGIKHHFLRVIVEGGENRKYQMVKTQTVPR